MSYLLFQDTNGNKILLIGDNGTGFEKYTASANGIGFVPQLLRVTSWSNVTTNGYRLVAGNMQPPGADKYLKEWVSNEYDTRTPAQILSDMKQSTQVMNLVMQQAIANALGGAAAIDGNTLKIAEQMARETKWGVTMFDYINRFKLTVRSWDKTNGGFDYDKNILYLPATVDKRDVAWGIIHESMHHMQMKLRIQKKYYAQEYSREERLALLHKDEYEAYKVELDSYLEYQGKHPGFISPGTEPIKIIHGGNDLSLLRWIQVTYKLEN